MVFWMAARVSASVCVWVLMAVTTSVNADASSVVVSLVAMSESWLTASVLSCCMSPPTPPMEVLMAVFSKPTASVQDKKPPSSAETIEANLVTRPEDWLLMAVVSVFSLSATLPSRLSTACLTKSSAWSTVAVLVFIAPSIAASFVSRSVVLLFIAFWIAASFCSAVPLRERMAVSIRVCPVESEAKPSFTAASIRAIFSESSGAWLATAASTAAIFSSSVPSIAEKASAISA